MEENTEVDLDGRKYLWDGETWVDPRTYMVPPDAIIDKLNNTFRKHEIQTDIAASRAKPSRSPSSARPSRRASGPPARFVPASLLTPKAPPPPPPVERLTRFEGEHAFLGNGFAATVYYEGRPFASVWTAYEEARQQHARLRLGMQREWDEQLRLPLVRGLLRSKFSHPDLRARLLDTADKHLSNQADDADPYWDAPAGKGENALGKLLMELRAGLRRNYCLQPDEQIVEDLRGYRPDNLLVPDEALLRDCCWKRLNELLDLYRVELDRDLRPMLQQRREHLSAQAAASTASAAAQA